MNRRRRDAAMKAPSALGIPTSGRISACSLRPGRLRRWPWRASLAVRCARRSWKRQVGTWRNRGGAVALPRPNEAWKCSASRRNRSGEATMEQYVGLDVSLEETAVCVLDKTGKVIWRGRCSSDPDAIARTVRDRAPFAVRMETGQLSPWLVHGLRRLDLPVVC